MGSRLYDRDADPAKREKMQRLVSGTTSESLGFRIAGILQGRGNLRLDKSFGKSLTPATITQAWRAFFNDWSTCSISSEKPSSENPSSASSSDKPSSSSEKTSSPSDKPSSSSPSDKSLSSSSSSSIASSYNDNVAASKVVLESLLHLRRDFRAHAHCFRLYSSSILIAAEMAPNRPARARVRIIDFAHSYYSADGFSYPDDSGFLPGLDALIASLERFQCQ